MIIKYYEFIKENSEYTPEDFGITDYEWVNGKLDCYQYVNLSNIDIALGRLPFEFGKIKGNFNCSNCGLTSLDGSPEIINGNFNCSDNKIVNYINCPKFVDGAFISLRNDKMTIEDYPLCIITIMFSIGMAKTLDLFNQFGYIFKIVKKNKELFIPLLNDKVGFHQMVMRIDPSMIQYYTTIQPPSKKTIL